jgi:hypothetical protein
MKYRYLPACVLAAVTAAGIAAAPTAAAENTGQTCINTGAETTQCQSPGNVQIDSSHDVQYPDPYPFWGTVLLFHHGGNNR